MRTLSTYQLFRRLRRDEGQSVLEFAIILPLLVMLILFLVEFGLGMNDQVDATQVASQAARLAAVNSPLLAGGVQTFVQTQADTGDMQKATVAVCTKAPDSNDPYGAVKVTVTSHFDINGFIATISVPITGSSTMRLEQAPSYPTGGICS